MKTLKYNVETEVTKQQYKALFPEWDGVLAHRTENGKYYVKLLATKWQKEVEETLNKN